MTYVTRTEQIDYKFSQIFCQRLFRFLHFHVGLLVIDFLCMHGPIYRSIIVFAKYREQMRGAEFEFRRRRNNYTCNRHLERNLLGPKFAIIPHNLFHTMGAKLRWKVIPSAFDSKNTALIIETLNTLVEHSNRSQIHSKTVHECSHRLNILWQRVHDSLGACCLAIVLTDCSILSKRERFVV